MLNELNNEISLYAKYYKISFKYLIKSIFNA